MIRELEWKKGIAPELLKDETHIKVRMFDEKPADSELEDIVNSDYEEMLIKKASCSYCGTDPALGISWWGPSINQATGKIEDPMFTFPSCEKHLGFRHLADTCRGDWAATFSHKWKKSNGQSENLY